MKAKRRIRKRIFVHQVILYALLALSFFLHLATQKEVRNLKRRLSTLIDAVYNQQPAEEESTPVVQPVSTPERREL